MLHFGIIGKPLAQSFSARFFNEKFAAESIDAEYSLYPLSRMDEFPALIDALRERFAPNGELRGLNVTIPYKTAVIPYLSELDETAKAIGAVNVIRFFPDGRAVGYNSDALGFMESLSANQTLPQKALILGTGGAAKACMFGLRKLGIEATYVSRTPQKGQLGYDNLPIENYGLIVNCTPLGMYPNTEEFPPIDYNRLTKAQFLYDCIYNPEETVFLRRGRERGCRTQNGTQMLLGQARAAWKIWTNAN